MLFKTSKIRKFREDSRKEDFIFPNFRIQMFRMKRILIFGGILLIVISFLGVLKERGLIKGRRYSKDLKDEFYQTELLSFIKV